MTQKEKVKVCEIIKKAVVMDRLLSYALTVRNFEQSEAAFNDSHLINYRLLQELKQILPTKEIIKILKADAKRKLQ